MARLWTALKKRPDFLAVRSGKRVQTSAFIVQIARRASSHPGADDDEAFRIGFTVTKKIGNAVERNRIKRRLRSACDLLDLPAARIGCDCVIVARRTVLTLPFPDLVERLNESMIAALSQRVAKHGGSRQKA